MPKKVAEHIIQIQRRFFWGKNVGERGGNLIAWDVIQKPLEQGGLGVGDIFIKNASLLFKWWWRFVDDLKPLWKEIIRSNHDPCNQGNLRSTNHSNQNSLWNQITSFENFSKEVQEVARKGIRMKVGNGERTRFWSDLWVGEDSLLILFPRLFGLSTQKEEAIVKMGEWVQGQWRWKLLWRRELFVWEELVGDLLLVVNQCRLKENVSDVRVWAADNSPHFLVSKFVSHVHHQTSSWDTSMEDGRMAWRNVAPPRAQLHVWFLLQGRINTKERLFRFGARGITDDRCTFCKNESETINHLFFECKFSACLWNFCCSQWNVSYCLPNQAKASLLSWTGTPFTRFDMKIWMAMFYVTTWSIWNIRNLIIFQGLNPNWEVEKRKLFWRLGSWARGWCHEFPFSPDHVLDKLHEARNWSEKRADAVGWIRGRNS